MKTKWLVLILVLLATWFSCGRASRADEPRQAALEKRAEAFIDSLAAENAAPLVKQFDEQMLAALNADALSQIWQQLQGQAGPFQKRLGTRAQEAHGYTMVFVTCQFEKMALDAELTYDQSRKVAGLHFVPSQAAAAAAYSAPDYVHSDSFEEKETSIPAGDCTLGATLTIPRGPGPFPAVVLVHGSGPNDRDETIGPNKPFKDIAWGLASRGIAVLRYEKRTRACPAQVQMMKDRLTVKEETIDDAVSAVALLCKTEKIDHGRVYVLGHSLGGMVIPRIGEAAPKAAGFIVMAGTARPMEDVILDQVTYLSSLAKSPEAAAQLAALKQQVALVKSSKLSLDTPSTLLPFGAPASYWLDLRGYYPPAAAERLKKPFLILQGERDYQATMVDFADWEAGLKGAKDVVFRSYPALNHLFMEGTGKATPAEYDKPGHVSGDVVSDVAAWILKGVR